MRVLVTGGAGFLGSHVVQELLVSGHEPVVLDNLTTGFAANVPVSVPLMRADVRTDLAELFAATRPQVVIHLAAQVSVPVSVQDPATDLAVNVNGTVNVLEAAARAGVRKLIAVSSAAVYGDPQSLPLTEESPTHPLAPYGLSKLTAEQYVRLLGRLRGIAYTILRPANIFGPCQVAAGDGAVVPTFLDRFRSGQDPVIHGDGSQSRDFIYVRDMARAISQAMAHGDGLTLNVSTGVRTSVNALWHALAHYTGWRRPPVHAAPRAGDTAHSVMANDLARGVLHWEPTVTLEAGLAETVSWALAAEAAAARCSPSVLPR